MLSVLIYIVLLLSMCATVIIAIVILQVINTIIIQQLKQLVVVARYDLPFFNVICICNILLVLVGGNLCCFCRFLSL